MTVITLVQQLPRLALNLLFPLQCLGCQREGKLLCGSCEKQLPRLDRPYCLVCAQPNAQMKCRWCRQAPLSIDGIRAPYLMQGPIREVIHSLKYRSVRAAAPEIGRLLAQYLSAHPVPGDLIVPVPLHPRRLRERGYNQSVLLAREMAELSGLAVQEKLLVRTRNSPPQVAGTREQRRENVEGSFQCNSDVGGQAVILVDDVATTGSTLSACASALKSAGAASVWGLVLAREG